MQRRPLALSTRVFLSRVRVPVVRAGVVGLTLLAGVAGCSDLDLGPQPDSYVGPGRGAPRSLTDATLTAVLPVVPGDVAATQAATATRPAATQATTLPAKEEPQAEVPGAMSVQEAILVGLRNSSSLRVSVYNVPVARTSEESAVAAFDPVITGGVQGGATGSSHGNTTNNISGNLNLTQALPSGTKVTAGYTTSNVFYTDAPASSTGLSVSVTQQLLRGAPLEVNLATLREAQIGTKISQYQLRGVAETLVASIEDAYWDLVYSNWNVQIVQNSVNVARDQLNDTIGRIQAGSVAETERAAADAQLATQEQALIDAKSDLETKRITFLQLITPPEEPFWDRDIKLTTDLFTPTGAMDPVEKHVDVAMRLRPDINQTKLQIQQGNLRVVVTKNGLLPQLDFFVNLSKTGNAKTFGTSVTALNGDDYAATFGVSGELEPLNRAASASYTQSVLSRDQLEETLRNQSQTVELTIRTRYIEVLRTRQQIDASAATLKASQAAYDVEVAKFRQQRSTSLLVAQAQNSLLQAQLNQKQSLVNHLKALVALYSAEGSLLIRRGLDAPGATPAPDLAWRH